MKVLNNVEDSKKLNSIKSNIIDWYDFREKSTLLVVGDNTEAFLEKLCTKLSKVVVIGNRKRNILKANHLNIINEPIERVNLKEKFDYILIKDNLKNMEYVKEYLNINGTILLLLNNRFGIANFAGVNNFNSILQENTGLYSKQDIEDNLKTYGFDHYKFFYPLPNYQIANVIFSDDYLPEYNNTKLMNPNLYHQDDVLVFNELQAMQQLTKNGEFSFFSNSYFVEVNPKTEIKFASFNNSRKEEYRLCTKIYNDYVIKQHTNEKSKKLIDAMKENIINLKQHGFEIIDEEKNGEIISRYISKDSLYQSILSLINHGKIEDVYGVIENWFEYIKSKFELDHTNQLNKNIFAQDIALNDLTIVKKAYIDLVFENTFVMNDNFIFFDQEWVIDNLPLEFILYRAINNLYMYNSEIEKIIPRKDFLDRFNLAKYLPIFEMSERIIQNNIIDDELSKCYSDSVNHIKNIKIISDENKKLSSQIGLLDAENSKKEAYIEKLTKNNGELSSQIGLLDAENSKKEAYIEELIKNNGKLSSQLGLLDAENSKKEAYIEELTKNNSELSSQLGLLDAENSKKEKYIEDLKNKNEEKLNNLISISTQKDEIIHNLNEIIKVKDHQIFVYENMRAVKLVKKLRRKQ